MSAAEGDHRPIQGISSAEAAEILGMDRSSVDRLVMRGVLHRPAKNARNSLDRNEVEQLALERYEPSPPYWMTTLRSPSCSTSARNASASWCARAGCPIEHAGRWLFRRRQVEVMGKARDVRWNRARL